MNDGNINTRNIQAVVAQRFWGNDKIQVDCHWKTQVWNLLEVCLYGTAYLNHRNTLKRGKGKTIFYKNYFLKKCFQEEFFFSKQPSPSDVTTLVTNCNITKLPFCTTCSLKSIYILLFRSPLHCVFPNVQNCSKLERSCWNTKIVKMQFLPS